MPVLDSQIFQSVQRFDLAAFNWCQHRRLMKQWILAAKLVSRTADGWAYPLLPLLVMPFDSDSALYLALSLMIAFPLERIGYFVLKNSFKRRRPPDLLPQFTSAIVAADKFSFPSGHTSAAVMVASLLIYCLGPVGLYALPWAVSVGVSRVFLGVHFPTDIAAGAVLGSSIALLISELLIG